MRFHLVFGVVEGGRAWIMRVAAHRATPWNTYILFIWSRLLSSLSSMLPVPQGWGKSCYTGFWEWQAHGFLGCMGSSWRTIFLKDHWGSFLSWKFNNRKPDWAKAMQPRNRPLFKWAKHRCVSMSWIIMMEKGSADKNKWNIPKIHSLFWIEIQQFFRSFFSMLAYA